MRQSSRYHDRPRLWCDERGSTLIAALLACASIGAVLLALLGSWTAAFDQASFANTRISALNLKANLAVYFKNDASWVKIRDSTSNPTLGCLRPSAAPCASLAPQAIPVIFDGAGNIAFDGNGNDGFNQNGDLCHPSSETDPTCLFSVDVKWEPQCSTVPCIPALIKITGTIVLKSAESMQLNAANYRFQVIRAP